MRAAWGSIRSEVRGALFALGLILAGLIALGHVVSSDPIILILSNIRLHTAVLMALVALFLMASGAWIRGLVLLSFPIVVATLVYREVAPVSRPLASGQSDIKVIAFNLLGSNLENGRAIADVLAQSDADLVFLNESSPVVPYLNDLKSRFPYQLGCREPGSGGGSCGDVLLLSRLTLDASSVTRLTGASAHQTVTARVMVGDQRLNVVAAHLLRPYFGEEQTREFVALRQLLEGVSGPTLVAGDFNAAAWSTPFTNMLIASGLRRAPFEPGTWPVEMGDFGIPIDHVLTSGGASLVSLAALEDHFGSNHRGLVAEIALVR